MIPVPQGSHAGLTRLHNRILEQRRRLLFAVFLRGLVEAACLQLLLLPLLALASSRHPYQSEWLLAILWTYVLYAWPVFAWWKARRADVFRLERIGENLDRLNPGSPDVFRTVLSLENHGPETLSALERFYAEWENHLRVPRPGLFGKTRLRFIAGSAAFALIAPLISGHSGSTFYRMILPVAALKNIPVPRLHPFPPERVALGDTVRIPVRLERLPASEPVYAHLRSRGKEERYPLKRTGDTAWFRIGPVQGDFAIRFSALRVMTSDYRVQAVPPPYLRSFSASVKPPAYTRLPAETLPEFPSVFTALPGSRIDWRAHASLPLRKLLAVFREPGHSKMDTLDLGGGSDFVFQRAMRRTSELRLHLFSSEDGLSGRAGPYRLEPRVDAPPEVVLLSPAGDGELPRSFKVPILFRARDDYGISRVALRYSIAGQNAANASGKVKDISAWLQPASGTGAGIWQIGDLPLKPGDAVEMHLETADNDAVSGPKISRSQTIRLRIPSIDEVMAGMNASEHGAIISLKSAAERENRLQRETAQANGQSPQDAPPPLDAWEFRRILNSAPQDHLQRLDRHLEAELTRASRGTQLERQLESLRKEVREMRKKLPPANTWEKPIARQKKILDTLMGNQQQLDKRLSELKPLPPPDDARQPDALAQERNALKEELKRNLKEQQDLKAWMQDQERDQNVRRQGLDQASQAEQRVREDVKQALAEMQKSLQKGMENGVLSPDLLKKMERIQELLREAIPDSTMQRLQRDAEDQQVGMEDVQRNLKDLLDRKDNLHQGLDRAIKMLEMLRDMHALENLSRDVHELGTAEEKLAEEIGREPENASLQPRQADLRERMENVSKEMDRLSSEQKAFQKLKNQSHGHQAEQKMRDAETSLKKSGSEKRRAEQHARSAAKELKQMAEGMDGLLNQMKGGPDPFEISEVLDETLEFGRWLDLIRDRNLRFREGWEEEDNALYQRASQTARWLRGRMEKLAASQPYESDALRREASALGFQADALSTANAPQAAESLMFHSRKAARELLKWLQQASDGGEGSMDGSGNGSGMGGKSGGKGKGKGQGGGDDEGLDGLAGRLKGISGKQMAVNQATYQILQSLLNGRNGGQSPPNGSLPLPGGGKPGEQGQPMDGRGKNSSNGSQSGGQQENGGTEKGGANSQQGIGESLERMAESASDAGGAARKLRQLAEEARALEKDLRQDHFDPEEVRKRQERFQTRLLEAANAMEERGRDRQRQAQAYRGEALKPEMESVPQGEDVFRELRKRRDWARSLPLPPEQKRQLEWYYESLLTR